MRCMGCGPAGCAGASNHAGWQRVRPLYGGSSVVQEVNVCRFVYLLSLAQVMSCVRRKEGGLCSIIERNR